ncbi:MAG: fumarylacetoacetate hydrolase family protein [Pseudomonadota bacterium]
MIPNLAIGVMRVTGGYHLVARIDDFAVDLFELASASHLPATEAELSLLAASSVNAFLELGAARHREIYDALADLRIRDTGVLIAHGIPSSTASMALPLAPGDFVDFYANRYHAQRCADLTGDPDLLPEAWNWMPFAYHGRTASILGDGSQIPRPSGWVKAKEGWSLRASRMVDYEMELGFVLRRSTQHGEVLALDDFEDAVFGAVLVIDWSARDLQGAEAKPLGPFHAKAFATQVGNWIVPVEMLNPCQRPARADMRPNGRQPVEGTLFDIGLTAQLSAAGDTADAGHANLTDMAWTPAEMLAHLTQSGAPVRSGDLFATGTISGPDADMTGCLLERQSQDSTPLIIDGGKRHFLEDSDTIIISASMEHTGQTIPFDQVRGTIVAGGAA